MNREQRRAREQERQPKLDEQQDRKLGEQGTPQDVTSTRAKSERKGKVTADKWNQ
jgi:hypothetical protein